jgi:tRNA pseudouridine55 synthase
MDGVLLVDKPAGMTSAGVVRVLKRRVARRKIGHLGTLDPFATGLLPLCVGEATKIAQFLAAEDKVYAGRIRLGVETDSLDCTGRVVRESAPPALDPAVLATVGARFAGRSWQVPPMYSAVKQGGVPLYRLARQGIEVERAARPIEIRALDLAVAGAAEIDFRVTCSKGTYVRVLAADIARALGGGGHLVSLRRTGFGRFEIDEAHALATLEQGEGRLPLLPIRAALAGLRELSIGTEAAALLRRGRQSVLRELPAPSRPTEAAMIVTTAGRVVGVVEADWHHRRWRLVRTLADGGENEPGGGGGKLYKPRPVC